MTKAFEKIKDFLLSKTQESRENNTTKNEKTKTVYRLISEREKNALDRRDISGIGFPYFGSKVSNNFDYSEDVPYIHFFDDLKDARDIMFAVKNKSYLCTYDIPISILKAHSGKSRYMGHSYDEDYIKIKEYAIPAEFFKFEWLTSIQPAKEFFDNQLKESM